MAVISIFIVVVFFFFINDHKQFYFAQMIENDLSVRKLQKWASDNMANFHARACVSCDSLFGPSYTE